MYAIRCDARYEKVKYLYLTNESANNWWTTSNTEVIRQFETRQDAQRYIDRNLKFSNPNVVKYNRALLDIKLQIR